MKPLLDFIDGLLANRKVSKSEEDVATFVKLWQDSKASTLFVLDETQMSPLLEDKGDKLFAAVQEQSTRFRQKVLTVGFLRLLTEAAAWMMAFRTAHATTNGGLPAEDVVNICREFTVELGVPAPFDELIYTTSVSRFMVLAPPVPDTELKNEAFR